MIHDAIQSTFTLIGKLAFFIKVVRGYIISLIQRGFRVFPKIKVGNLRNPFHDVIIIPFSTS